MKKAFIVVLVALVILAAPAGAYFYVQYHAQRTMEAVRVAVEDLEGGKMTYGPVAASLFDGTMTVRDIVYASPGKSGRITIAKAVLSGDSETDVSADLKSIAFMEPSEGRLIDLGRLDIDQIDLTPFDTRDELTPDRLEEGLRRLTLGRLVATELAADLNGEKFHVGAFRLEDVAEGMARNLSVTDGAVAGTARGGDRVDLRVKSAVFENLDLRSFRNRATEGPSGAAMLAFLQGAKFSSFSTDDLTLDVDALKSSMAHFEIKDIAKGKVDEISFKGAELNGKHKNKPLSLSIGSFMVNQLDLTSVQPDSSARSASVTGKKFLETIKVGDFLVRNASLGDNSGKFAFEKIHLQGLTGGVVQHLVVEGGVLDDLPEKEVKAVRFKNITFGNLDLKIDFKDKEKLRLLIPDYMGLTEGHVSGVSVVGEDGSAVSVARLGFEDIVRDRGIVVSAKAFVEKFELPLSAIAAKNPEAAQFLGAFNEKAFRLDADAAFDYDIAAGNFQEAFTLGGDGMGRLSVDLHAVGFDLDTYRRFVTGKILPSEWLQRQDIKVASLTVNYDDDKLADTIVDMLAGGDRSRFAAQMAQNVTAAYPEPRFIQQAKGAVKNFLTGAHRFYVSARPAAPVTVPMVIKAFRDDTLVQVLNLEILGN